MILVIGLDGADLDIMGPMFSAGKLPNLDRLMRSGAYGKLNCPFPPMTLPSWASFMTGVNPGKHNIFDFIKYENHDYHYTFTKRIDCHAPTIWQRLSEQGLRLAVLGFPGTYPPDTINGVMIAGFDSPVSSSIDHTFITPREYYHRLKKEFSEIPWVFNSFSEFSENRSAQWFAKAFESLKKSIQIKRKTILSLLKQENFDCVAVHFNETDTAGHHFWHLHDKNSPHYQKNQNFDEYAHVLEEIYQELDYTIGTIENELPSLHHTLIVSDHGFGGSNNKIIYLNEFLRTKGYLHFKTSKFDSFSFLQKQKDYLLSHIPPKFIDTFIRTFGNIIIGKFSAFERFGHIDWLKTYAFSDELNYAPRIRINCIQREPMGIVAPGKEFEILAKKITDDLLALTDPETQKPIIKAVHRSQDLYQGAYTKNAADLILEINEENGYSYNFLQSPKFQIVRDHSYFDLLSNHQKAGSKGHGMPGSHRKQGVFIVDGPDIKKSKTSQVVHIQDLANFVLWAFHCKANWEMDGKLPDFCDNKQTDREKKTTTIDQTRHPNGFQSDNTNNRFQSGQYQEREKEIIYKRLVSLGYLE